ncbi:hypothetical protein AURDEDRAFT_161367 [Auricularia subglabra TFB-10046 SS5]|nr:hypothetical protein AURDEDRAFT_161367 [Auricularia subglabra TFB-10046 SS5]
MFNSITTFAGDAYRRLSGAGRGADEDENEEYAAFHDDGEREPVGEDDVGEPETVDGDNDDGDRVGSYADDDPGSEDSNDDPESFPAPEPASDDDKRPAFGGFYVEDEADAEDEEYDWHQDYESFPDPEPDEDDRDRSAFPGFYPPGEMLPVWDDDGTYIGDFPDGIVPAAQENGGDDGNVDANNDDVNDANDDQRSVSNRSGSGSLSGRGSESGSDGYRSHSSSPELERFDYEAEAAERAAANAARLAELASRPRSPTADVELGIPHYEANDIRVTKDLVQSLAGLSSEAILRALLGSDHGVELSTRNGPRTPLPTPPASPRPGNRPLAAPAPPPPPVLAPALARAVAEATAPRNRLKRTFDGDYFVSDGQGGYMSTRTQRHVAMPFGVDYLKTQETSTLRHIGQMVRAGQAAQPDSALPTESQTTQTPAATSLESQDVDPADPGTAAQQDAGDCSTSDDEVTSSRRQQTATAPVDAQAPSRLKRAREEDEDSGDESQSEKRRRVRTEQQQGSQAVSRPRATRRILNVAGPSTAATRTDAQVNTAATTAPHDENEGVAVVEPTERIPNGSDEIPMDSTPALPAAEPAQEAAQSGPVRRTRTRTRAAPGTVVPSRRSQRIQELAEKRAAGRAADAAAASPTRRGKRGRDNGNGNGNGKGKGRA